MRWGPRRYTQRLPSQDFVELLQNIQGLREVLLVIRTVGMFTYKLAINMHIENAMGARDQLKGSHIVSQARQNLARHPEGAESMFSIVAILYADI